MLTEGLCTAIGQFYCRKYFIYNGGEEWLNDCSFVSYYITITPKLWFQSMFLLYLWILWVRNLDRTQQGQLVSVPQSQRPYLGTHKDWGWLRGQGLKTIESLAHWHVGDECWLSVETSIPHLVLLARTYIWGLLGFLTAWRLGSKRITRKLFNDLASEVTPRH